MTPRMIQFALKVNFWGQELRDFNSRFASDHFPLQCAAGLKGLAAR